MNIQIYIFHTYIKRLKIISAEQDWRFPKTEQKTHNGIYYLYMMKIRKSSCKCFLSSGTMLELFRDPAELQRSEQRDRRAVIGLWKLIRHLCKREKLERRHLQLSDEASLSERLPFLFLFFLWGSNSSSLHNKRTSCLTCFVQPTFWCSWTFHK